MICDRPSQFTVTKTISKPDPTIGCSSISRPVCTCVSRSLLLSAASPSQGVDPSRPAQLQAKRLQDRDTTAPSICPRRNIPLPQFRIRVRSLLLPRYPVRLRRRRPSLRRPPLPRRRPKASRRKLTNPTTPPPPPIRGNTTTEVFPITDLRQRQPIIRRNT